MISLINKHPLITQQYEAMCMNINFYMSAKEMIHFFNEQQLFKMMTKLLCGMVWMDGLTNDPL